jgi:hypothetical protein
MIPSALAFLPVHAYTLAIGEHPTDRHVWTRARVSNTRRVASRCGRIRDSAINSSTRNECALFACVDGHTYTFTSDASAVHAAVPAERGGGGL